MAQTRDSGLVDVTHLLDKEQGSALDWNSMFFTAFDGGSIFRYDSVDFALEMKEMLVGNAPDPKAQTLESALALPIRRATFNLTQGRARDAVYERIHSYLFNP